MLDKPFGAARQTFSMQISPAVFSNCLRIPGDRRWPAHKYSRLRDLPPWTPLECPIRIATAILLEPHHACWFNSVLFTATTRSSQSAAERLSPTNKDRSRVSRDLSLLDKPFGAARQTFSMQISPAVFSNCLRIPGGRR